MLNLTKHQKGKRAYFPTKGVYLYRGRTSNQNMGRTYFGRTSESQVYIYFYTSENVPRRRHNVPILHGPSMKLPIVLHRLAPSPTFSGRILCLTEFAHRDTPALPGGNVPTQAHLSSYVCGVAG